MYQKTFLKKSLSAKDLLSPNATGLSRDNTSAQYYLTTEVIFFLPKFISAIKAGFLPTFVCISIGIRYNHK